MTVEVELGGSRYVEDRDTTTVVERLEGPRDHLHRALDARARRAAGRALANRYGDVTSAVAQAAGGARGAAMVFRPRDAAGSRRARHLSRRHSAVRTLRAPVGQAVPGGPARVGADRGRHRDRRRHGAARRGALVHAGRRVLGRRPRGRGRDARDRAGPLGPHRGGGLAGARSAPRAEPAAPARAACAARAAVRARLGGPHLGRPLGARRGRDGARARLPQDPRRGPRAGARVLLRRRAARAAAGRAGGAADPPRPPPRRARRARSRPVPGR